MTSLTDKERALAAAPSTRAPLQAVVLPVLASLAVVAIAAFFLQHFPATMLAGALALLAIGRLAPVVGEVAGSRAANLFRGCVDFAGAALLAIAATQGALGEIARALFALAHR